MTTINLKDFYYWYLTDELVEVPDEVAEELMASKRREAAHAERVRYNKAYYSLDCDDGIEYVESENASGTGNIYYNGKLVKYFLDLSPSGDVFTFQSTDGGSINVQTIYENDKIVGVKEME